MLEKTSSKAAKKHQQSQQPASSPTKLDGAGDSKEKKDDKKLDSRKLCFCLMSLSDRSLCSFCLVTSGGECC